MLKSKLFSMNFPLNVLNILEHNACKKYATKFTDMLWFCNVSIFKALSYL